MQGEGVGIDDVAQVGHLDGVPGRVGKGPDQAGIAAHAHHVPVVDIHLKDGGIDHGGIGIAGGLEKCGWLTSEAGFDAAIDYKSEPVDVRLKALCPEGINIFFDNVGGDILDAVLALIAMKARVVLCGGISRYNEEDPSPGPKNYFNLVLRRGRMEGFIVLDYASRFEEAIQELAGWVTTGRLKFKEDIQEGFENAPRTFLRLFEGKNFGKQLLKIADPPLGGTS